jgi:hypothetical protein
LHNIDDDEDEMDCDVNHHHHLQQEQPPRQFIRPLNPFYRVPYHRKAPPPYYCNTSPSLAQYLSSPTTTPTSSYTP